MNHEEFIKKIKSMGCYHLQLIPTVDIKHSFKELDTILEESIVKQGTPPQFPLTGKYEGNENYYVCNIHRISHVETENNLVAWDCSSVGKFDLHQAFLEDQIEKYATKNILDIDHFFRMITSFFIFARNLALNLQVSLKMQIDLYGTQDRCMKALFNNQRELDGNYLCHASQINLYDIDITSYNNKEILEKSDKYIIEILEQFQLLDDDRIPITDIINQYHQKYFPRFQ